jgi:putative peptidoglycan lipid II flippase
MAAASARTPLSPPPAAGGLAIAAAIVAFGFLGSRVLGILRTTFIARAFGAGPEIDAYNVAFRVPDLIFQLVAGATLASAFIPVFARVTRRDGDDRAWELASNVLNLVMIATAALCVVAFIVAPVVVPWTAPGLDAEATSKAVSLTRIMLVSPLLFAASGIVTGILNGRQRFMLTALAPMLYNIAIIFGAVVLSGPFGIEGLAIAVIAGAGLHLGVQVPGLIRERMRYRPSLNWRDPAVREVGRLMGPRVVGLAAAQFNFVIGSIFATQVGEGAFTRLTFAWTIGLLPVALFGMALSTAVFPRLANHMADNDLEAMRNTLARTLRVIMFLTIPAALGLLFLRDPATRILLQWGEFSAADAGSTAAALGFFCLAIVPLAGIEIHSRGFYAMGDTKTPVALAVLAVALNLVLSALLWEEYGINGLAFSLATAAWIEWVLLYWLFARRAEAAVVDDLGAMARFALAGAVMALFLAVGFAWYDEGIRRQAFIVGTAGAIAGVAVYMGMALWMRIPEMGEAIDRVLERFGRGPKPDVPLVDENFLDR